MNHTKKYSILLLHAFICLIAGTVHAQDEHPPLVKVLATGGTIANTPGGRVSGEAFVQAIPEIKKYARLEVVDMMRVGSASIAPVHWLELARKINEVFLKEPDVKGIVVTHGSNTAAETVYFLSLVIKSKKPVVVTASQRKFTTLSSDSPKNFLQAVQVAASDKAVGKGALLVTNDVINSARDVRKNMTYRMETYASGDLGYIGSVDDYGVEFYREPVRKHTSNSEFSIASTTELPRVDVIMAYAGASGDYLQYAVEQGKAQGIVFAGFPTGSPSPQQEKIAEQLVKKYDIPVVMTNRGGIGRPLPNPERPFLIYGDNLVPEKARILLMLALTRTKDRKEIQRMFNEY